MSDRFFLDTNILAYTFDATNVRKRERSHDLVVAALGGAGMISFQVAQEFLNLALKNFLKTMTSDEAREYLDGVLVPLCQVHSDPDLYREGITLRHRWGFSFYDSLVVAAAIRGGCTTLYTEDLQHGQRIGGLTVIDPFV